MERGMADIANASTSLAMIPGTVLVTENGAGLFGQDLLDGRHRLVADEPAAVGGADAGPNPYELLLMSLGACTSMTLRLYAKRKQLPLTRVAVRLRHSRIHAEDCAECETKAGSIDRIEREIVLEGKLDADQRKRMLEIADMCPVHRTLTSEISIVTRLAAE
jgi:putative redox protein